MSSGFSGGGAPPEFYNYSGGGRSNMLPLNNNTTTTNNNYNNPQLPYRSTGLSAGNIPDPASQILHHHHHHRPSDLIGKRSLAEFQQQHHLLQLQKQQQQQGGNNLGFYLRNVKPRIYQQASPISPLSPVDFSVAAAANSSSSISPEVSSISSAMMMMNTPRYGHPILQQQQLRSQPLLTNSFIPNNTVSNLVQNRAAMAMAVANQPRLITSPSPSPSSEESEKNMMNKLQELEKELLDDDDDADGGGDGQGQEMSAVTNSEWSEAIQNLITPTHKPISPSPTSSSSSCSSTSASAAIPCPKQSLIDAASAISEGKPEVASEILTRLTPVSNVKGTSQQRLTSYMAAALRSRVNPTQHPPPVSELFTKEHAISTQHLYEVSPCFKLGFMAANLAILEATSTTTSSDHVVINKLHVIDFDIGQGGQYVHLLHALAAKKDNKPSVLKITTFTDFVNGGEEKLKVVGDGLKALANKVGLSLIFNVMDTKICDLSPEKLGLENDEALAVNFAFRLYKLPDESVTTENLRDELLRRVKKLSPKVVTVVEQEMNANTAAFVARVNEACGYYGALFDSLDSTVSRESLERVRIEEGLGRKMANSVACEGRDRVERCEVFGKWRARLSMAGFEPKPMSQLVADSLRFKLNSGARGNPGFTVTEQAGGVCFGWMERTLTVASAWH